ncbi:IS3 family transposase [Priestia endophytica]|uniref:IS3 family transposase n=1 Tax=Priestia endophytica TaxID=135735 RepID=UPI000F52B701
MENFFSHFKSECFRLRSFPTTDEVKIAVAKYIHFYNHERFQKKLNHLSHMNIELRSLRVDLSIFTGH